MRRLLTSFAVAAAALAIGACGNKTDKELHGTTEGAYLDLGELKYQVQISRLLNPAQVEDRAYFVGLDPSQIQLPAGQEWFAVFMRVENDGEETRRAARAADYTITDTSGTRFRPESLPPVNVFAYRGGGPLPPEDVLPEPDSPAGQGSIQGSLLLFKIPTRNLENRPLELSIRSADAPGEVATVDLDV